MNIRIRELGENMERDTLDGDRETWRWSSWTQGGRKVQNMPVVHCSDIRHTFYDKHTTGSS